MSTDIIVLCLVVFMVAVVVWILRAAVRHGAEPPRVRNDDTVKQLAMWSAMNSTDGYGGATVDGSSDAHRHTSYGHGSGDHSGSHHGGGHDVQTDAPLHGHDGGCSDCGGGCGDGGGGGGGGDGG